MTTYNVLRISNTTIALHEAGSDIYYPFYSLKDNEATREIMADAANDIESSYNHGYQASSVANLLKDHKNVKYDYSFVSH